MTIFKLLSNYIDGLGMPLLDMVQYLQKYLKRICYFIHILALPMICFMSSMFSL